MTEMTPLTPPPAPHMAPALSRRRLLLGGAALAVVAACTGNSRTSNAAAENPVDNSFSDSEWRALSEADWRERLTPEQFDVLRKEGTERAGTSPLDKVYDPGTYHCAGCDLPLFSSDTKYDSRTGWPSFWDVIDGNVATKPDTKLFYTRTEYHCARCLGHQGHVFEDGPAPTGLRYCNNGVALTFKPA